MDPKTIQVYKERMEEGYDVDKDKLFSIWSKLQDLSINDIPQETSGPHKPSAPSGPPKPSAPSGPSILDEILQYPHPPPVKRGKSRYAKIFDK